MSIRRYLELLVAISCILGAAACSTMSHRFYGVTLDSPALANIHSIALVAAYENSKAVGGVKANYNTKSGGAASVEEHVSLLSVPVRDAAAKYFESKNAFKLISTKNELQWPPPTSDTDVPPLDASALKQLAASKADGYLLFWAQSVQGGVMQSSGGIYWGALYSAEGKPIWCRRNEILQSDSTRVTANLGIGLSSKNQASMAGTAMARALGWSAPGSQKK